MLHSISRWVTLLATLFPSPAPSDSRPSSSSTNPSPDPLSVLIGAAISRGEFCNAQGRAAELCSGRAWGGRETDNTQSGPPGAVLCRAAGPGGCEPEVSYGRAELLHLFLSLSWDAMSRRGTEDDRGVALLYSAV